MSVLNLEALFQPSSVAVIGASNKPGSVGTVVMRNLLGGEFEGPVMPVHPDYESVAGVFAYPDVKSLPLTPDLAVICTPPETVPEIVTALRKRGTRGAVVVTSGLAREERGKAASQMAMLRAAKPGRMRILGPNTIGLLVPGLKLNASFAHTWALPGRLAFAGQSGGLATAVLDQAHSRGIGFSHFISLGDMADVDFGDALDYLGSDPSTDAILLYIESIRNPRKFMSAARAAARNKMVLAIKAGRVAEGARAATSHTGALAGADDVFDIALMRAGLLRVREIDELFSAVETLGRSRPLKGERLVILSNSGGPAVMATDELISGGGKLAKLSESTLRKLDEALPQVWSGANPVDILGDSPPDRYAAALQILLDDPGVDAVLVLNVPTAVASCEGAARAVVSTAGRARSNVLTCWLGSDAVESSRRIFADSDLATYETPEKAVRAFLHIVRYRRNQETLIETPPSIPTVFTPDVKTAREVISRALEEGRTQLSEPEGKQVLTAYQIPTIETRIAQTPEEAAQAADAFGYPVALKILSPDISHKSDIGGVVLNLQSREAVFLTASGMEARFNKMAPHSRFQGFSIQRMAHLPNAYELIVGVTTDAIFGPIILFGQGGTAVEVIGDRSVALPPLNMGLARKLISRTRVSALLEGYRNLPPADINAVCLTLVQISQMIVDLPEITDIDINPLLVNNSRVLALDARFHVQRTSMSGAERLSIRPYPQELEETVELSNGRKILLRPIRPEDEAAHHELLSRITPEDIRFRFFGLVKSFPHAEMVRFTQIDYDRQMAFIATAPNDQGQPETLGVVRAGTNKEENADEFAILVRSDLKGQGIGRKLMDKMIRYSRERGAKEIYGQVMRENEVMINFMKNLGFHVGHADENDCVRVGLKLQKR